MKFPDIEDVNDAKALLLISINWLKLNAPAELERLDSALEDQRLFRYLSDEADPSEFVRLCAGRTGLAVWREVIGAMMENGK